MTDIHFTVAEFVELLVSSLLAGALTGTVVVCLFLRFRKQRLRRRQELHDEEQNGTEEENKESSSQDSDGVTVIRTNISRQTPPIPIQDPPDEENRGIFNNEPNVSALGEAGIFYPDRPEAGCHGRKTPELPPTSPPLSAVAVVPSVRPSLSLSLNPSRSSSDHIHTYPPTTQTSPTTPARHSQYNRPTFQQDSIFPRRMNNQDDGGTGSVASATLSRTTTNVSTLPPYDTLSTGPPRYSLRSRTISSPSVSVSGDQLSRSEPRPPIPADRWWTKPDEHDDNEVDSEA